MNDQSALFEKKMQILLGLRGFAIVKLTETQALWKINSNASITADVTIPSKLWEVNYKGSKTDDWKTGAGLPASICGMIQSLEEDFIKACAGVGILITSEDVGSIDVKKLDEFINEFSAVDDTQEPVEVPASDVKTDESLGEEKPVEATQKEAPTAQKDNVSELINALHLLLVTPTNPGFTRTRGFEVSEEVKVA